jgi:hypothetical protein
VSLASRVGGPEGRNYNPVAAAYDGMDKADRDTFKAIIHNDEYTPAQIANAMREIGYDVDRKQVQHYRERVKLGKVKL